jgi:hypothetical protein
MRPWRRTSAWQVTAMSDLVAFLTARLDEDEAAAKAADGPPGSAEQLTVFVGSPDDVWAKAAIEHIRLHDPKRVLREVDAKRKILTEHGDTVGSVCARCVDSDRDGDYYAEEPGPCLTLRALAAVWSGHPDYAGLGLTP